MDDYLARAGRLAKKARQARWFAAILIYLAVVLVGVGVSIAIFLAAWWIAEEQRRQWSEDVIVSSLKGLLLLLQGLLLIWIVVVGHRRRYAFERLRKQGAIVPLHVHISPMLASVLLSAGCRMSVDVQTIQKWLLLRPAYTPSIAEAEGDFHLIIPMGLVKLCSTERQMAEAMFSHELAHIKHGDIDLWRFSDAYAYAVSRIYFPIFTCLVILFLGTWLAGGTVVPKGKPVDLILGFFVCRLAKSVLFNRRESEELADVAVVKAGLGDPLHAAIKRFVSPQKNRNETLRGVHPSKGIRLRIIREAIGIKPTSDATSVGNSDHMDAGHDDRQSRKIPEELLALKDVPTPLDKFLGFVAMALAIVGTFLGFWVYENMLSGIPCAAFFALLLYILFVILPVVGFSALAAWLVPSKPYPANTFTPPEWEDFLRKVRPKRQEDLLRRTSNQSLGLRKDEFLALLQSASEHIWKQAQGIYLERCAQLEEELRADPAPLGDVAARESNSGPTSAQTS